MIIPIRNYLRPKWVFRKPVVPFTEGARSPLYRRNEAMYMVPAQRASDPKIQKYILEALDPSGNPETGARRTHSGQGASELPVNPWLHSLFNEEDAEYARSLAGGRAPTFPLRKLYSLTEEYLAVWAPDEIYGNSRLAGVKEPRDERGPFPFVDENVSLLRELTAHDIFFTRSRVRDWRHPKWRVYAWWRRRFYNEYIARRRANHRDAILGRIAAPVVADAK
jgi:hypothetical protein